MRQIAITIIFIYFQNVCAQSPDIFRTNKYFFNDGKDSIVLTPLMSRGFCLKNTTSICDKLQIDGQGLNEVVLYRSGFCIINEHGGSFDIDESVSVGKYEVWNLDTKQMLFDVITYYKSDFNRFRVSIHTKGCESYTCNFRIDSLGTITISDLKTDYNVYEVIWKTITKHGKEITVVDKRPVKNIGLQTKNEGIYKYLQGGYILLSPSPAASN